MVRYSGLFFNWTREELRNMDQITNGLVIIHKVFYSIDDRGKRVSHKKIRSGRTCQH